MMSFDTRYIYIATNFHRYIHTSNAYNLQIYFDKNMYYLFVD